MTLGQDDFEGTWQIDRQIDDRRAGQRGAFDGAATFVRAGPKELRYLETGQLQLADGPVFHAERSYVWRFDDGCVDVRFSDGRAFHSFVPSGVSAGTDHPCGADYYRVTYDFARWPDWSAVWSVSGPAKDYTMTSQYKRA